MMITQASSQLAQAVDHLSTAESETAFHRLVTLARSAVPASDILREQRAWSLTELPRYAAGDFQAPAEMLGWNVEYDPSDPEPPRFTEREKMRVAGVVWRLRQDRVIKEVERQSEAEIREADKPVISRTKLRESDDPAVSVFAGAYGGFETRYALATACCSASSRSDPIGFAHGGCQRPSPIFPSSRT